MKYTFICEKCNKEKEMDIPMSEYDNHKDKQYCECKNKMIRKLEWQGVTKLCHGCCGVNDTKSNWTN